MDAPSPKNERIAEIVAKCRRRWSQDASISDESIIGDHADLMPELADALRKARVIDNARRDQTSTAQSHGVQIRCPHCHGPVELIEDSPITAILCPLCGSSFSLALSRSTANYQIKPAKVGHFELLDQLGMGAFGTVWKAHDTELDRTVAVKIPRKEQLSIEESEQFLREARSAAQLRHANIVSVHEVGRDEDNVFIVSDYVEGLTLADWLTGGNRLSFREAAAFCAKVADALDSAHEAGVIHRDLKPSNIMLDVDWEPHITDFGLAKRDAGEITVTSDGRVLGTPAYMPPEQAEGKAHLADRRSDVYSLGVILFELLTGERPFRGNERMLLNQVINEEAPSARKLNGKIPRDLETICQKCLEKDPPKRYSTTKDLADEMRRFLQGQPIRARPITTFGRTWRWAKRKPAIAGLVAAVATLLLTVAVVSSIMSWRLGQARTNAESALMIVGDVSERALELIRRDLLPSDAKSQGTQASLEDHITLLKGGYDILERLKDVPDEGLRMRNLAAITNLLGDVYLKRGKREDTETAKQYYEQALEWRQKLAEASENANDTARVLVAESCELVGKVSVLVGDFAGAKASFATAHELYSALAATPLPIRRTLATLDHQLADVHFQLGDSKAALKHYETALQARQEMVRLKEKNMLVGPSLVGEDPAVLINDVGLSWLGLGDFYLNAHDDLAKAWDEYKRAFALYHELWRGEADALPLRRQLAAAHYRIGLSFELAGERGLILAGSADLGSASTHYERALDLRQQLVQLDPSIPRSQVDHALAMARCGRVADAETIVDQVLEQSLGDAIVYLDVGRTYAICSTRVEGTPAMALRDQAFKVLEDLRRMGWTNGAAWRNDPDLVGLRSDPRFAALIDAADPPIARDLLAD